MFFRCWLVSQSWSFAFLVGFLALGLDSSVFFLFLSSISGTSGLIRSTGIEEFSRYAIIIYFELRFVSCHVMCQTGKTTWWPQLQRSTITTNTQFFVWINNEWKSILLSLCTDIVVHLFCFFLFASVKTWVSSSSFLGERVHDPIKFQGWPRSIFS